MGNQISHQPSCPGKVILSDGGVEELKEAITVAELMLEHPQHVVVEFDPSAVTQKTRVRPKPLPADQKLNIKKTYLMLPAKRGGGKAVALSSEQVRRIFCSINANLRSWPGNNYVRFLPWLAKVCPAVVEERKEVVGRLVLAEEEECVEGVGPEYLSRQLSGRGWKPSLDTIKEKTVRRKVSRWLF